MQSNSPIKYFIIALRNRLGFNEKVFNTRLLVSQDDMVLAAQKFHNRLFQVNSDKRPILLNQSGSGWNPVDSTKYFLNRKIVLLTRDPRDQFAELKMIKQARSVEGFIDWYKELQRRLEKISNPDVLHLRFEEFVNNNEEMINVLCTHMSLNPNILSNYDPNLSRKNIGKYKDFLSHKEIDVIQKDLSKYIN